MATNGVPQEDAEQPGPVTLSETPEQGVVVPTNVWHDVMAQLNDAWKQLAAARERAARAEARAESLSEEVRRIQRAVGGSRDVDSQQAAESTRPVLREPTGPPRAMLTHVAPEPLEFDEPAPRRRWWQRRA